MVPIFCLVQGHSGRPPIGPIGKPGLFPTGPPVGHGLFPSGQGGFPSGPPGGHGGFPSGHGGLPGGLPGGHGGIPGGHGGLPGGHGGLPGGQGDPGPAIPIGGQGGGLSPYHKFALKKIFIPIAGAVVLGAAAALASSNPILLQLGVTGKRRRRHIRLHRNKYL